MAARPTYQPAGYCPTCGFHTDPGICPDCGRSNKRVRRHDPTTRLRRFLHALARSLLLATLAVAALLLARMAIYRWFPISWLARLPSDLPRLLKGEIDSIRTFRWDMLQTEGKAVELQIAAQTPNQSQQNTGRFEGWWIFILGPDGQFVVKNRDEGKGEIYSAYGKYHETASRELELRFVRGAETDNPLHLCRIAIGNNDALTPTEDLATVLNFPADACGADRYLFSRDISNNAAWKPDCLTARAWPPVEPPPRLADLKLPNPLAARALRIESLSLESASRDDALYSVVVHLDVGASDGVFLGLPFWITDCDYDRRAVFSPSLYVSEVTPTTCIAEGELATADLDTRPAIGMTFITGRNP